MDNELAIAQALKYADELRQLHAAERVQRRAAEEAVAQLKSSYTTTVRALAAALELRDDQTGNHAERVSQLALELTHAVAPDLAADREVEYGFLLHDVGKIGIRDAVLLKPGPLDRDELREMRFHTTLGERILSAIPFLRGAARNVVAAHHERWDGAGYPLGLRGAEIPLVARIFSLADSFDAMTHDRPYRRAMSTDAALDEIVRCTGRQFDPELSAEFVELARAERSAA